MMLLLLVDRFLQKFMALNVILKFHFVLCFFPPLIINVCFRPKAENSDTNLFTNDFLYNITNGNHKTCSEIFY